MALAGTTLACAPAAQPGPAAAPAPAAAPQPAPAAAPAKPAAPSAAPAAPASKPAANAEPDAALVEAAKKEGKLVWYTSLELTQAKSLADTFEKQYGIAIELVRSGSERVFSQFMKEQGSNVKKADVIHTSDASNFLTMRTSGFIAPYRPKGVDAFAPALRQATIDPDGYWLALRLSPWVIVYNTTKVREGDAPKGWKDLLDPKWKGRAVLAHPAAIGSVVVWMQALLPLLGADYLPKLAKNEPLIVQSGIDVAAKTIAGERDVGAGTLHYNAFVPAQKGNPIKSVFTSEGVLLIVSPQALVKDAPHPNAAKLFLEFSLSREAQQFLVSTAGLHSPRGDVTLPDGQVDLTTVKTIIADPAAVERAREALQKQFKDVFGS